MCITVDNASSNDTAITQLRKKMVKKNAFALDGDELHMRCCCHIINLVVKDGLDYIQDSIKRLRDVVKYIRSSPQSSETFKRCCKLVGLDVKYSLQLDCPTRWNSTYLMLDSTLKYRKAFDKLDDLDKSFEKEFGSDLPGNDDWKNVGILHKFLKKFYDVTCKLSGSLYSTSNIFLPEIMKIIKELESCKTSNDDKIKGMGSAMRDKFDKYWGSTWKMNVMLFIAIVLDPRYKLNNLKVKYTTFYSESVANDVCAKVLTTMQKMVDEYNEGEATVDGLRENASAHNNDKRESDDIYDYFLLMEREKEVELTSDIDKYLDECAVAFQIDFDVLLWWRLNAVRFPALSKVARDVLAVQCSTVASESAFSTGGRTLDQFRSSLLPTTAEVLICCQDWLRQSSRPINIEETIEELESRESEIRNDPEVLENIIPRIEVDC